MFLVCLGFGEAFYSFALLSQSVSCENNISSFFFFSQVPNFTLSRKVGNGRFLLFCWGILCTNLM